MDMRISEKMLTVKDVQKLIGCGRNKVYQIIASNTLPAIQIGKQYYIPQSEYEKWVNRNLHKQILLWFTLDFLALYDIIKT